MSALEEIPPLVSPSIDAIQVLMDRLAAGTLYFNVNSDPEVQDILKWRAFRRGYKPTLISLVGNWKEGRRYTLDPLPRRASQAYSDFLFNESPLVTPAVDKDRQLQVDLLRESKFGSKTRAGSDICVSEGEVWWRIYTDPMQSVWPIIAYHSRVEVRVLIYGDRAIAIAFVNYLGQLVEDGPFYHHLEYHTDKRVENVLYLAASETELGREVPLSTHPLTENIEEEWIHGLPMLAGRVRNGEEGLSIYDQLEDLYLDLNEAHTVDSENFRLAGKKRAMIPRKYKDQAGNLDSGEEIFWTDDEWDEMGDATDVIKIMEYQYDAKSSVDRKDDLERIILTRSGLVQQLVDSNSNEGLAQTGTALRTRLIPGVAAVEGIMQEWQGELPHIISLMDQVDAMPEGEGGWGRPWEHAESPPAVEISPVIPVDQEEEATRHSILVTANLESVEHAVQEQHPDWTNEQRELEVKRILANKQGYALDDQGKPVTPDGSKHPVGNSSQPLGVSQNTSGMPPGGAGVRAPVSPSGAGANAPNTPSQQAPA